MPKIKKDIGMVPKDLIQEVIGNFTFHKSKKKDLIIAEEMAEYDYVYIDDLLDKIATYVNPVVFELKKAELRQTNMYMIWWRDAKRK